MKKKPKKTAKAEGRPFNLSAYLAQRKARVERELSRRARSNGAGRLGEAMRYALLAGGKRLRPILVLAACEAVGAPAERALAPACAIEMVHTYSLVHDDLPAMDDDDLRRGQPTVHKKYDEAMAILAGDALLTEAFTLLAAPGGAAGLSPGERTELIHVLGEASGHRGMVLGQALDLEAEGQSISEATLRRLHRAKTGALLTAALSLGAVAGGAGAAERRALERYGRAIGLAFQIMDDVLDETSDTKTLGKRAGADKALDKSTFPKILGIERSRREAEGLIRRAQAALEPLGRRGEPLRALAGYIVERKN